MRPSSLLSPRRLVAATGLVVLGLTAGATVAAADTTVTEGAMTLTVSQSDNLPLTGGTIIVSGSGYDEAKGIYVAVCVDNGPGQQPTPCIGGADMSGEGGGSGWISSNPPEYAQGLTTPFGPGGTFEVTMAVNAVDPIGGTDCTQVACSVVTRADHTRTQDRSLDVKIPLTFSAAGVIEPVAPAPEASASVVPEESVEPSAEVPSATDPTSAEAPTSEVPESTTPSAPSSESVTSAPSQSPESSASEPMMSIMQTQEVAVDEAAAESESSSAWIWWVVGGVVVVAAAGGFVLARQRGKQKAAGHE